MRCWREGEPEKMSRSKPDERSELSERVRELID